MVKRKVRVTPEKLVKKGTKLGQGNFGQVFEATVSDRKEKVVLKRNARGALYREVDALTSLRGHPHIVQLLEVVESDGMPLGKDTKGRDIPADSFHFLLEKGEMDLRTFVQTTPLTVAQKFAILLEVLLALEYIHFKGLIHSDLKMENILLVKSPDGLLRVKVSDFGISQYYHNHGAQDEVTTTWIYRAPEVFKKDPYDFKIDVWSWACIAFELLTGVQYVRAVDPNPKENLGFIILNDSWKVYLTYPSLRTPDIQPFLSVLAQAFQVDPVKRASVTQLLDLEFWNPFRPYVEQLRTLYPRQPEPTFERMPDQYFPLFDDFMNQMIRCKDPRVYMHAYDLVATWHKIESIVNEQDLFLRTLTADYLLRKFFSYPGQKITVSLPSGYKMAMVLGYERELMTKVCDFKIFTDTVFELWDQYTSKQSKFPTDLAQFLQANSKAMDGKPISEVYRILLITLH